MIILIKNLQLSRLRNNICLRIKKPILPKLFFFAAAYPLHDGSIKSPGSMRHLLYREWASLSKFWKYQPLGKN